MMKDSLWKNGAMSMQCPICAGAKLVHDTREIPYIYKGDTTVIEGVTGDFCPACEIYPRTG